MPDWPATSQRIAPMAEKPCLIRQRIMRHDADRNTKRYQPRCAIAWKVKLPAALAFAGCEKPTIGRITRQNGIAQICGDFIGWLVNTGADDRYKVASCGPQPLHGENCFFQNTQYCATPASMGAADHAGLAISQKHRRAITGNDGKRQTFAPCCYSISFGALVFRPGRFGDHHALAMHLRENAKRLMRQSKRRCRTRAILPHRGSVILTGERAIQRCESAR